MCASACVQLCRFNPYRWEDRSPPTELQVECGKWLQVANQPTTTFPTSELENGILDTQPMYVHTSHRWTQLLAWSPKLKWCVCVCVCAGIRVGVAKAGGERTWSRAGGQRANKRGFTIRYDCILFIFSRTLPTNEETDRQTETQADREEEKKEGWRNTIKSSRFVFREDAEVNVIPSLSFPSLFLSIHIHPPSRLSPSR